MRQLKSGGDFLSFDTPIDHFGLGEHREVARVEETWSTGERTELTGPFRSGALHTITRRTLVAQEMGSACTGDEHEQELWQEGDEARGIG